MEILMQNILLISQMKSETISKLEAKTTTLINYTGLRKS